MSEPTPLVVTDEMRRAVMRELCAVQGHAFSLTHLRSGESVPDLQVTAGDETLLPHLSCSRCQSTWIVLGEPGEDYDDAEMRLRARLYKSDPVNKRPERTTKTKAS